MDIESVKADIGRFFADLRPEQVKERQTGDKRPAPAPTATARREPSEALEPSL